MPFVNNRKRSNISSLEYDKSGSAAIRIFGRPAKVDIHYYNPDNPLYKFSLPKLVCPRSINLDKESSKDCIICTLTNPEEAFSKYFELDKEFLEIKAQTLKHIIKFNSEITNISRICLLVYDMGENAFRYVFLTENWFSSLCKELSKNRISQTDIIIGNCPIIYMQRLGNNMEFSISNQEFKPVKFESTIDNMVEDVLFRLETKSALCIDLIPSKFINKYIQLSNLHVTSKWTERNYPDSPRISNLSNAFQNIQSSVRSAADSFNSFYENAGYFYNTNKIPKETEDKEKKVIDPNKTNIMPRKDDLWDLI